ncbi:allene oxide cyclase barrel-like domain-containing protein [Streptomyces melanogenes]|uniref:allene oxide cyclase barrel-like domain-containing protein n=1 Tax=Streptomyces melanogenes TaxID=67326 RepID=UPI00167EDECA|nr:hypothetical protein [Streptomyces melanogenes]GGP32599.1 hypothetical protein GCM10010278_04050 [Streptomyces melanogenes]
MRKRTLPALGVAAATAGVVGVVLAISPSTAGAAPSGAPHSLSLEVVEKGTAINMVDVAPADSALGDQLIGTGDLIGTGGRKVGTSSFQGISTDAKPRTSELLTFVYDLGDGRITTSGTAKLSATGPVFDEQFAITGGTGKYKNARGQVRVLQETVEQAKVTFDIQL